MQNPNNNNSKKPNNLLLDEESFNKKEKELARSRGANRLRETSAAPSYGPSKMTVAEALSAPMAAGATSEAVRAVAESRGTTVSVIPVPLPPPVVLKMWSSDHIAQFLRSAEFEHVLTPVASIYRDLRDPRYQPNGGVKNIFTRVPTFAVGAKDADAFSALASPSGVTAEVVAKVRRSLEKSNDWVFTNMPFTGLMARFREGLLRKRPGFKVEDYVADVLRYMPVRRELLPDLRGKGAADVGSWVEIDGRSSYGAPFFLPKITDSRNLVLLAGVPIAAEILSAVQDGTISKWMSDNQALCVVALNNKMDKYEVAKLREKIRPVYCFPFHFQYLFSAVFQPLARALPTFLENPLSSSAHRFSWNYGGANRLYHWIASSKDPVRFAVYSDDMLFVFVTADGKVYVWRPDIKQMDASLSARWGNLTKKLMLVWYEGKLDNTWTTLINLATNMAFRSLVSVAQANVALVNAGLLSGVAGTPEYDQVAGSVFGGRLARKFFSTPAKDLADLRDRLLAATREAREFLGLEVKEDTMGVDEFVPGGHYPWLKFLGHELLRHEVSVEGKDGPVWVPVRPYDSLVLSYVTPKGTYGRDSIARIRGLMSRLVGITASGGWYYPELYAAAASCYNTYHRQGVRPAAEHDMTVNEFLLGPSSSSVEIPAMQSGDFPARAWFESLVIPPTVLSKIAVTADLPVSNLKVGDFLFQEDEEVTEHNAKNPKWSDQRVSVVERTKRKAGDAFTPSNPAPIIEAAAEASAGRIPPISDAKKKAYNAAWVAARREQKRRFIASQPRIPRTNRRETEALDDRLQEDWEAYEEDGVESVASVLDEDGKGFEDEDYYAKLAPMTGAEQREYDDAVERFLGLKLAQDDWQLVRH